jgi:PE-PPE domain
VVIALFACASMMLLALMSMISVPISRADDPDDALTALMMGGSGMPTPSEFWQDYIDPATGGNYTPVLVPTPESFASTSVPTGLADLQAAMGQQAADQPYLVEGYSQSAVIAIDEEIQLMQSGQTPPDATFLLLGSLNRPDGGIFERFPGLVIPGTAGFDFNGAEPTDAGIPTIDIATQYDFFADFPQYPSTDWPTSTRCTASSTHTPPTAMVHSPRRFPRCGHLRSH